MRPDARLGLSLASLSLASLTLAVLTRALLTLASLTVAEMALGTGRPERQAKPSDRRSRESLLERQHDLARLSGLENLHGVLDLGEVHLVGDYGPEV